MPPRTRLTPPIAPTTVRRAVRPLARTVALVAILVAVLAIEPDILRLIPQATDAVARLGFVGVAAAIGVVAVRSLVSILFARDDGDSMATLRTLTTWVGYGLLVLLVTSTAGVNLSGFLLGSAVIGVVVGVAAQSSLGNLFAGAVLLVSRPYRIGDWCALRNAGFGYEYDGEVVGVGAVYTTLLAEGRMLRIPNSVAMTAVVRIDELPLRAAIDAVIPDRVSPRALSRAVRDGLSLRNGDRVLVWPTLISVESHTLSCRVEVRAHRSVESAALPDVIRAVTPEAERPTPLALPARAIASGE